MNIRIRTITPLQLTAHDIQNWLDLESRSLENNIYMSPNFAIPAIHHLDTKKRIFLILIEQIEAFTIKMIGLIAVTMNIGNKMTPGPYLETYHSHHSYLGTPLIDKQNAHQTIDILLKYLKNRFGHLMGVVLNRINLDGNIAKILEYQSKKQNSNFEIIDSFERPILIPEKCTKESITEQLGKKYKEAKRCMRRLVEQGHVDWVAYRQALPMQVIDNFLRLEHSSWKGNNSTSILSKSSEELFFRKMVLGFASDQRTLFTELKLNGSAIASTCNFVSGDECFAFKVGYDPEYRKYGVGILNEIELMHNAQTICQDISCIDSGSYPDSFISHLWLKRRQIGSIFIPFGKVGKNAWRLHNHLRSIVRSLRKK